MKVVKMFISSSYCPFVFSMSYFDGVSEKYM